MRVITVTVKDGDKTTTTTLSEEDAESVEGINDALEGVDAALAGVDKALGGMNGVFDRVREALKKAVSKKK